MSWKKTTEERKGNRRKVEEGGRADGGQCVQPASGGVGGGGYTSVSGGTLAVSLGVNSRVAPAERASHAWPRR